VRRGSFSNRWAVWGAALLACVVLTGWHCPNRVTVQPDGCQPVPDKVKGTLNVLAGSELKDLEGAILDRVRDKTRVSVVLNEIGTLAGVEQVVSGRIAGAYQAIWFSTNGYLRLHPKGRTQIVTEAEVMRSPVILGLTEPAAQRVGWSNHDPSWTEIAKEGANGRFTFGMTEPASSNSGFSALVALTAALADTGAAVTEADVRKATPLLHEFFKAQELFEGSSGWLSDVYAKTGHTRVDGLINYESELLRLNADVGTDRALPKLRLLYPTDGVVMADYPLSLLASASAGDQERYRAVVDCLLETETQRMIMNTTHRRPVNRQVALDERFRVGALFLLRRPGQLAAANTLIRTFKNKIRRPANAIYVLDTSGSMGDPVKNTAATGASGARSPPAKLDELKDALDALAGADPSISGKLSKFNAREGVTLLPFSDTPEPPRTFTLPSDNLDPVFRQIKQAVKDLRAQGATALYDALISAYGEAKKQATADESRFTTIVLLTDGEATTGATLCDFRYFHNGLTDQQVQRVRVHVVFLRSQTPAAQRETPGCKTKGTHEKDMRQLADFTGGLFRTNDNKSLTELFKEIRGYQ
jgi:Ca-activated chloride channel family protein